MPSGPVTPACTAASSRVPVSRSTRTPSAMRPRSEYTYWLPGLAPGASGVVRAAVRRVSGVGYMLHSGRKAGRPEVWVNRLRTVTLSLPPAANSGTYRATGASRSTRPRSTDRAVPHRPADCEALDDHAVLGGQHGRTGVGRVTRVVRRRLQVGRGVGAHAVDVLRLQADLARLPEAQGVVREPDVGRRHACAPGVGLRVRGWGPGGDRDDDGHRGVQRDQSTDHRPPFQHAR